MWIDHHCHLPADSTAADIVSEATEAGVVALVNVGCDIEGSRRAAESAARFDTVWATAGVHPHDAKDGIDGLEALLDAPRVVAVGECGLDYHYMHSPIEAQREVFAAQISLALRRDLPLVIHTREAWDDTFGILDEVGVPERTVFHCFTGDAAMARRCLDLGARLSFSGIVTFPSSDDLRAAASICPLDRLLVETDSPYLAPVPHRGRRNHPALVSVVGAAVAAVLDRPEAEVAVATTANAIAFYGLDPAVASC